MMRLAERIRDIAKYCAMKWDNHPRSFQHVELNVDGQYTLDGKVVEANLVGFAEQISHFADTEIAFHLVNGRLTELRYLRGLPVNAVYEVNYEPKGKDWALTTFQPIHVESIP